MADDYTPDTLDAPAEPTTPPEPSGLPWTEDDHAQWHSRIKRARTKQALYHGWWEEALKSYSPQVSEQPEKYQSRVRTNRSFTTVERKRADLFYQRPELTVAESPLLEELPEGIGAVVASTHGTILNEKIGLDGVNVKRLASNVIFDYEICGCGWSEVGYRAYTKDTPTVVPVTDAMGQPVLDPMTGQPQTQPDVVPVVIKSECFWEHFSPKQALIPAEFRSTDFDQAPWLGRDFSMSLLDAKRLFNLPADFKGSSTRDNANDMHFDYGDGDNTPMQSVVTGTRIHYKSSQFREDIVHPDHLTELVLIDGIKDPVKHEDCPLQTFDDQGRLTPDSLVGFPMHPLVIRSVTDTSYVMSDIAIALPLVNELDISREQGIKQRAINLLKWFFNTDTLPKDALDKAVNAPHGGMIGLPGTAFNSGDPIKQLPVGHMAAEDYGIIDIISHDLDRTHAIDANASGTNAPGSITATESSIRQANVNVTMGHQQGFVADWFVQGATKFSTILQRYLSVDDAAAIVGRDKAGLWDQMRHTLPTRFAFTMTPDSSLRNDTPLDRKQHMDAYTMRIRSGALSSLTK
jgi:hypothetical protein